MYMHISILVSAYQAEDDGDLVGVDVLHDTQ